MENLQKSLKRLKIEDIIWIIYFFIVSFALYSNKLERDYLLRHNNESRKKFHEINKTIFIVTFIIYLYFAYAAYEDIKDIDTSASKDRISLQLISFIGNILFLIGGAIFLYVEVKGNTNEEEDIAIE